MSESGWYDMPGDEDAFTSDFVTPRRHIPRPPRTPEQAAELRKAIDEAADGFKKLWENSIYARR